MFLRSRLPTHEDAQDAAQESLERLVRYSETEPVDAWRLLLYRIAVNVAHDHQRRAKARHASGHVPYEEALQDIPADDCPQDEQIAAQQLMERFWAVIVTLPPRRREVYVLSRMEGMSYPQIARHCRISEKAVEKHMRLAMVTVRERLGEALHRAF